MSLTVDVVAIEPVPLVRLSVDVPGPWEVTGSSGGRSWTVAKGAGPGWLTDPWAPLGVDVSYELASAGATYAAGPVVRPYAGRNVITDLAGRNAVGFAWARHGGGRREYDVDRTAHFAVPGDPYGASLSGTSAGAGGGALVAWIEGDANAVMERLVMSMTPLIVLHNEAECPRSVCDIPRVQTVRLTQVSQDMTGRQDVVEREWPLVYRMEPQPWGWVPPVALVSDVPARFPTVADLAGSGLTVADLAAGGWLVDP